MLRKNLSKMCPRLEQVVSVKFSFCLDFIDSDSVWLEVVIVVEDFGITGFDPAWKPGKIILLYGSWYQPLICLLYDTHRSEICRGGSLLCAKIM